MRAVVDVLRVVDALRADDAVVRPFTLALPKVRVPTLRAADELRVLVAARWVAKSVRVAVARRSNCRALLNPPVRSANVLLPCVAAY